MRFLSSSMIFASSSLADVRLQVADPAHLDQGGRQEAAQPDVEDETTLDDLDDGAGDDAVLFLDLLDRAPGALVLGALLGQDQPALLVLLLEDQGLDLVADGDDLAGVDVVLDRQLARGDDALGLVADVEQDLVPVDLDDGAFDDVAVVEVLDGLVDGGEEVLGAADVVDGDLRGCSSCSSAGGHVEGAPLRTGVGGTGLGGLCSRRPRGPWSRAPDECPESDPRAGSGTVASQIKDNCSPRTRRARPPSLPVPRSRVKADCARPATPRRPSAPVPAGQDRGREQPCRRPRSTAAGHPPPEPSASARGNRRWWDGEARRLPGRTRRRSWRRRRLRLGPGGPARGRRAAARRRARARRPGGRLRRRPSARAGSPPMAHALPAIDLSAGMLSGATAQRSFRTGSAVRSSRPTRRRCRSPRTAFDLACSAYGAVPFVADSGADHA